MAPLTTITFRLAYEQAENLRLLALSRRISVAEQVRRLCLAELDRVALRSES